jgi:hypothetical protein
VTIEEIVRDDHQLLASLARALALRGATDQSQVVARRASEALNRAGSSSEMRRLAGVLGQLDDFPGDPVEAIVSVMATLSGDGLKEALALCSERLSRASFELVIADSIARSRASDVLAEAM